MEISLENLTKKLVVLNVLATAVCVQSFSTFKIGNIQVKKNSFRIIITDRIQTSGIGQAQLILEFPFFVYVAIVLKEYLHRKKILAHQIQIHYF